jgi:hypothetical protein
MEGIMTFLKFFLCTLLLVVVAGCAHDQCNNVPQRPVNPIATTGASPELPKRTVQSSTRLVLPEDSIQVSKPTGERQCSVGKAEPLDQVLTQFKKNKITVYESHTQADGLMHTDLCGAPGGNVNVFTISKKDLTRALKLGFKEVKN